MLPAYMLHQFEEHGVDLLGRHYFFLSVLCRQLGYSPDACPADPPFILAVNIGTVWIAGALGIALRNRNVAVGTCAFGVPLVNAFIHIGTAIVNRAYNPGLLTAIVLFLPLCAYALTTLKPRLLPVIGCGVATHVVLAGGILGFAHGFIGWGFNLFAQVVNGFQPLLFAMLLRARRG
jgi:hypothetical protein